MTDKLTSLITVSVALAVALTLGSEEVLAACTPDIWPNTDTEYITLCNGGEDIRIDVEEVDITAAVNGIRGSGIVGISEGDPSGDVTIDVQGGSVKTSGRNSHGIQAWSSNGDVTVNVQSVSITTDSMGDTRQAFPSSGIHAVINYPSADGKISILAKDVTILTSGGRSSYGVYGYNSSVGAGNTDIDIDVQDSRITTEGSLAHGILGDHRGDGDVNIDVRGSNITSGDNHGIYGLRALLGDRADITGDINIDARDSIITTKAYLGHGIYAKNEGITKTIFDIPVDDYVSYLADGYATGHINIDVQGVTITTESTDVDPDTLGTESHGIYGLHLGEGDINIDVQDGSTITTKGVNSYGIYGYHEDRLGDGTPGSNGDINIDVLGSSITTIGQGSHGILAEHDSGMGSIDILVSRDILVNRGTTIHASGAGASGVRVGGLNADGEVMQASALLDDEGYRKQIVTVNGSVMGNAAGIFLAGGGRVVIGPQGTIGAQSGIAILAMGVTTDDGGNRLTPKLRVDMNLGGRSTVAQALGKNWIINDKGETTIAVNGTVLHEGATGVTGRTAANGVWNVTMREHGFNVDTETDPMGWILTESTSDAKIIADRDFSTADFNEARRPSPPPPPPPMPMPQTVMVDEPVFGDADDVAGVHLPAGGRVLIGPRGTVGGKSGIAILAEGDAPMLHVGLRLDGRRVRDVIGDDWIINDGGETTIVVNDVTLHDGATGVVEDAVAPNGGNVRVTQRGRRATGVVKDAMAPNGAFNVTMRPEGVTVLDRSDPDPANWVITEPVGGVVADRDFSTEDFIETSTQPMFTEEYAPRAALYEILPDFLLRLTGPGPSRRCGSTPDSSVWTRVAGGQGVYESDRSTTGATYDLERFEAEGGLSASLGARAKGWVSVRHVQGTAGVASPTGGGEIDVRGLGSSVGGSWQGANDVYAVGCFSYLAYDVDFASTRQGVLKAGVDGQAYTLDLEVGRRYAVGEQAQLTPRVWVMGSRVSVDDFTDAVDARVSLANAARVLVGLGVQADTTRPWAGGAFLLRGSVDIEQMVSGATTNTQVSGERLSADATDTSLLFGLRGIYRHDRVTVGAELAARQELGSTDSEYTSFLNLGLSF